MAEQKSEKQTGSYKELSGIDKPFLSLEQQEIAEWLKKVRFRKTLFGGVSESDVWKKISELDAKYEQALRAERVRYDTLLEVYKTGERIAGSEEGNE